MYLYRICNGMQQSAACKKFEHRQARHLDEAKLLPTGLTKQESQIIFSKSSQSFCVLANSALKH